MFSGTKRSQQTRSGLDYSKIVIVKNPDYLDSTGPVVVDQDEYTEMTRHLPTIVQEATDYVDTYIGHIKQTALLHPREYERKYKYSTLPYFHDELGI